LKLRLAPKHNSLRLRSTLPFAVTLQQPAQHTTRGEGAARQALPGENDAATAAAAALAAQRQRGRQRMASDAYDEDIAR
jgi:hypothetical protein